MKTINVLLVYEPNLTLDDGGGFFDLGELRALLEHTPVPTLDGDTLIAEVHPKKVTVNDRDQLLEDAFSEPGRYQQLWLLGASDGKSSGSPLATGVVARIFEEMTKNRMGVFATGDHSDLGANLCGRIPRVRQMRYWFREGQNDRFPPEQEGPTRAETAMQPLIGEIAGSANRMETDRTPKPVWFTNVTTESGIRSNAEVHPLGFNRVLGRIGYLPDHAHEGTCKEAEKSGDPQADQEDFPAGCNYEQVAWAVRKGLDQNGMTAKPSLDAIVHCFDHPDQGRVVVDSTFHHFVTGNFGRQRMSDIQGELGMWLHSRDYPLNILAWLNRSKRAPEANHKELQFTLSNPGVASSLAKVIKEPSSVDASRELDDAIALVNRAASAKFGSSFAQAITPNRLIQAVSWPIQR